MFLAIFKSLLSFLFLKFSLIGMVYVSVSTFKILFFYLQCPMLQVSICVFFFNSMTFCPSISSKTDRRNTQGTPHIRKGGRFYLWKFFFSCSMESFLNGPNFCRGTSSGFNFPSCQLGVHLSKPWHSEVRAKGVLENYCDCHEEALGLSMISPSRLVAIGGS